MYARKRSLHIQMQEHTQSYYFHRKQCLCIISVCSTGNLSDITLKKYRNQYVSYIGKNVDSEIRTELLFSSYSKQCLCINIGLQYSKPLIKRGESRKQQKMQMQDSQTNTRLCGEIDNWLSYKQLYTTLIALYNSVHVWSYILNC